MQVIHVPNQSLSKNWVTIQVAVLRDWAIPQVELLLGTNAHTQLGAQLFVDLRTQKAVYILIEFLIQFQIDHFTIANLFY